MMSKYKTPIRIHIESIKKINEQTSKYRLPFLKDEPSQQRQFSVQRLENQTFFISSEVKPDNVADAKQTNIQKRSMRGQQVQPETQSLLSAKQVSQKQILTQEKVQQIMITLGKQQQPVILPKNESKVVIQPKPELKLQPIILNTQSNLKKSVETQLSHRNQIENKTLSRRNNHHSAQNRYTDEQQNFADRSRESEVRQTDIETKNFVNNLSRNMPTVIRKSVQHKPNNKMHSSLKKVERQVWQILAKSIQQQELVENTANLNKLRSKLRSKSKFSESQTNRSKVIADKLKELTIQKQQEQSTNQNENMYDQLPPISQDSEISQLEKQENGSVLKKLHQIISLQQFSKKNKKQIPLQQYKKQYLWIRKINPFFKKLNQLGGCVMLSIGKIKFLDSGDLLFTQGEPISHLSIIILGKVVLTKSYNHFKNYGLSGESLGQQALFDESKPYHLRLSNNPRPIFYRMQARALTRLCVLRINLRKFYKMSIELHTIGQKRLFNLIDNLFKINFLKKNALLHQQVKQRLQTEILVNRRKRKSSLFYH